MKDKTEIIVEIIEEVRLFGTAWFFSGKSKDISESLFFETKAESHKLQIESKLRDLVEKSSEQEPLTDEEIDALWVFCGDLSIPQKVQRRMIVRTAEAAHGITKGS